MSRLPHASNFNDLIAYQKTRQFSIGRLLNGMITKADQFCGNQPNAIRESAAEYFVSDGE